MSLDYSRSYPLYVFPFNAALNGNGRRYAPAKLLKSFCIDPNISDPCWLWLHTLVKRRLDEGHDYNEAHASLALFLQRAVNPPTPRFKILTCEIREIDNIYGWNLQGKAQEIKLACEVDGASVQKSIISHKVSVQLLNFLFRRSLERKFSALHRVCLVDQRLSASYGNSNPQYQALLTFADKRTKTCWKTVGVAGTPLHATLNALIDGYDFRLDRRFDNHFPARPYQFPPRRGGKSPEAFCDCA